MWTIASLPVRHTQLFTRGLYLFSMFTMINLWSFNKPPISCLQTVINNKNSSINLKVYGLVYCVFSRFKYTLIAATCTASANDTDTVFLK